MSCDAFCLVQVLCLCAPSFQRMQFTIQRSVSLKLATECLTKHICPFWRRRIGIAEHCRAELKFVAWHFVNNLILRSFNDNWRPASAMVVITKKASQQFDTTRRESSCSISFPFLLLPPVSHVAFGTSGNT